MTDRQGLGRRTIKRTIALSVLCAAWVFCLGVLGPHRPAAAQVDRANLQTELDAARARWANHEPDVYEVRGRFGCSRSCFGFFANHYNQVVWDRFGDPEYGGAVEEATGNDAPSVSVDRIFNTIQRGLDDDWDTVRVGAFDPVTGVPDFASFDPDFGVKDESDEGFMSVLEIVDRTEGVPGALVAEELSPAVSCLAGRGRVDINIVNTTNAAARFRIEFQGLSAREYTVEPRGQWRMPFTGRPNGTYEVKILRDGAPFATETVTVTCGDTAQASSSPELQVVNACRSSNPVGGAVRFQFVNPTDTPKPYVIRFSGRPGRSTTAPSFGQAIRAVNGLADGTYVARIFSGSDIVEQFMVKVACGAS